MSDILRVHCPVLLPKLLNRYNDTICKTLPEGIPSLMDFLTTHGHDGSDLLMGGQSLDSEVAEYERLLKDKGIAAPTPDEFWRNSFCEEAIGMASDMVTDGFLKYKKQKISQGPKKVFEDSYYNNIAANIAYFFEELENQAYLIGGEDLVYLLDFSLRDDFFEKIMKYASERAAFNVSDVSATSDEIVVYCLTRLYNERNAVMTTAKTGEAA